MKVRHIFSGSAASKIKKKLRRLGMNIARSSSSAIVKGREGPLEEGSEENFKQIAVEIVKSSR